MGMFDYVKADPVTCECGEVISSWQTKDLDCEMEEVSPDEVDNYYALCERCGIWHEFHRPKIKNLNPFIYTAQPLDTATTAPKEQG